MYKVFINNRPLILAGQGIQEKFEHNTLFIRYDSADTIRCLVNMAHHDSAFPNTYLMHDNVDELFEIFCKQFTVIEAAGGRVRNPNNELLMIFRTGRWDLPKGKIEKKETPDVAALREVEEECGIKQLTITRPLLTTCHTYKQGEKIILKKTHWFEMTCTDKRMLVPQLEEGITDVRWMDAADVEKAMIHTFASIRDVILAP